MIIYLLRIANALYLLEVQ